MQHHRPGRHELGQNFLVDPRITKMITSAVRATKGPIIEIGPGDGALTRPLERLDRPLTCIEVDADRASALRRQLSPRTSVLVGDFLHHRLPTTPYVLVGNIPFHVTTPVLRRVLAAPGWSAAVLLVQWEVARKRAGVGGATMMTAQWWPWFEFTLLARVPSVSFRPRPSVDGGVIKMVRLKLPLLAHSERKRYQAFVHEVFTGRGNGIAQIVRLLPVNPPRRRVSAWLREHNVSGQALPKSLTVQQWVGLFRCCFQ